jgi:hypothetical protein
MAQKITVTLNPATISNRSRPLQSAVDLLAAREKRTRLARELGKLDRAEERQLAEEGLGDDPGQNTESSAS